MLRELHIRDLGVIDDLDLELHPGLNVLTGETGAGKTMVTVGLALALGSRATAALVRDGAASAGVEARFDAPPDAQEWAEDGEVILARSVDADGRGRARISGRIATASALSELGAALAEIHGQRHAQRLLTPATQTEFLDRAAGADHLDTVGAYRRAWAGWRALEEDLRTLRGSERERERELDLLSFQVREIESVGPRPAETEELAIEEARLGNAESLAEVAGHVGALLSGDDSSLDGVLEAAAALRRAAGIDPSLVPVAERAQGLAAELDDLARDVRGWAGRLVADPERLGAVRERLGALRTMQRKYGDTDADVLGFLERARGRLDLLAGSSERVAELEDRVSEARAAASDLAARITDRRRRAAPELAAAIEDELHDLAMPAATVRVELVAHDVPGPGGAEEASLAFSPGPGQPARPLAKTASGGELSRAMLACRSVLADVDDVPTLVFDEVDAGIGGEAGLAVGRRLARLARERQVIAVTHLPQIACFADRHVRVEKRGGRAAIRVLDDDERVHELSRMLAGLTDAKGAVVHAEELLAAVRAG
ncbi:MAG: DNA repair protein RecN [Actinomycetota bacterium]